MKWYSKDSMEELKTKYRHAKRRLLLLDYDGVLVPLAATPEAATPHPSLPKLVKALVDDPRNTVVVISGRTPETLNDWLGQTGADMSAEHGHFIKKGQEWYRVSSGTGVWKKAVRQHMAEAVRKVPGSHIEEKHTGLVWHYRQAEPQQAEAIVPAVYAALSSVDDVQVSQGSKVIEARLPGADKGIAARAWLTPDYDFVLAAGDDTTDEDLFRALPSTAFSIKIGPGPTAARLRLDSSPQFIGLLTTLRSGSSGSQNTDRAGDDQRQRKHRN